MPKITEIKFDPTYPEEGNESGALFIYLDNGTYVVITDEGKICCEHRFMECGDQDIFSYYTGSEYLGAILKEVRYDDSDEASEDCDYRDIAFVEVQTSVGSFELRMHNQHNGYYAGFDVKIDIQNIEDNKKTLQNIFN